MGEKSYDIQALEVSLDRAERRQFLATLLTVLAPLIFAVLLLAYVWDSLEGGLSVAGTLFLLGKAVVVVALSSAMMGAAALYTKFGIKKKDAEYRRLVNALKASSDYPAPSEGAVLEEYQMRDYVLPALYSTVVAFVGMAALFQLAPVTHVVGTISSTFAAWLGASGIADHQELNTLVPAAAFIGAYIWSISSLVRRYATLDLTAHAFYTAGVRMLVAPIVAYSLWIAIAIAGIGDDWIDVTMPILAFVVGVLPTGAVYSLTRLLSKGWVRKARERTGPLELLQGVTVRDAIRLRELGIDSVQDLATSDVIPLFLRTNYSMSMLLDWVGQSHLWRYFAHVEIDKLRAVGVRSIIDLYRISENEDMTRILAESPQLVSAKLKVICDLVRKDAGVRRLEALNTVIQRSEAA